MSKYRITFIDSVEGRDAITHGGVLFPIGKAVEVDSDNTEIYPWFKGNSSFHVEEDRNETSEDQRSDDHENDDDRGADEDAGEGTEALEVTPAKRTRKKVAQV